MTAKRLKKQAQTTSFLGGTPTTFEIAFPTVETMRVEIRPYGAGFRLLPGQEELVQVYKNGGIPAIIDCRNPRCHDGGIDLNDLVWSVVHKKLTEFADSRRCKGHEANGSCDTRFKVKISVKYKGAA
jgi:hypothetical protein